MEKTASPREPEVKKQSTMKGILMGGGIGLLAAVLAYFAGTMVGRGGASERVASLTTSQQEAQTQLARSQEIIELQQARGFMFEAAVALERRNYGTASEDLRRADQLLEGVDPAVAGVDTAQLDQIDKAITALDLTVQSDVGAQRTRILDIAAQTARLIPEPVAEPVTEPAARPASEPAPGATPGAAPESTPEAAPEPSGL